MFNDENMTCYHFYLVIVQTLFIILKHFNLSLPNIQIHLSSAFMKHKKSLYMTSRAWSVWSKIKLYMDVTHCAGQGFLSFSWMNLIQLLICSVYEYRSLQSNNISTRETCYFISTIFFKLALRKSGTDMRQSGNLSFNLKIKWLNLLWGLTVSWKWQVKLRLKFEAV